MANSALHIVWDWNGTLLDDTTASVNTINSMLLERDLPTITLQTYRNLFGFPVLDFYKAIGFQLERENWDAVAEDFHARFLADPSIRLHAGALAALNFFTNAGINQSLLSASEHSILASLVEKCRINGFFKNICGVDNLYGHSKLELGRSLLARLALPPQRVLLIGDSLHDYEVARELRTGCLLISQGHQSATRLAQSGAPLIESLAELPHWFAAT